MLTMRSSLVLLFLASALSAAVKLPALISDHMLLQRNLPVHIWGDAEPGEAITVTLAASRATVTANAIGRWMVTLPPMAAGGPFALTVAGQTTVVVKDVAVGEVWVASGQSNMEWPMGKVRNAEAELAGANQPSIRLFRVRHKVSDVPVRDVDGSWQLCTPESVKSFSAAGYFFARNLTEKLGVPVAIIESDWGGTPAEAWTSPTALTADPALLPHLADWSKVIANYPDTQSAYERRRKEWEEKRATPNPPAAPQGPGHPWQPGGLYNGMIAPLTPYTIRGVIWYQGESNAGSFRAALYERLFETMIQDWRHAWGLGDFPFLFVQLANYNRTGNNGWPIVREAQRQALSLRNTGMAVTIDIGEPQDIHPTNKQDVGLRLALAARAVAYGENLEYSGPVLRTAASESGKMRVWLDHADGLAMRSSGQGGGFEVAGKDGVYQPAECRIEGSTVVVASPQVTDPVMVRYAWADNPPSPLVNAAGLPASPFRWSN